MLFLKKLKIEIASGFEHNIKNDFSNSMREGEGTPIIAIQN